MLPYYMVLDDINAYLFRNCIEKRVCSFVLTKLLIRLDHLFVNIKRLKHNFIISQLHTAVFGFIQCSFILYIIIPAMFEYTIFIESLHLVNICSIIKRKSSSSIWNNVFHKALPINSQQELFHLIVKIIVSSGVIMPICNYMLLWYLGHTALLYDLWMYVHSYILLHTYTVL